MPSHRPTVASSETGDPLLLTPGPLTTSKSVKQAMVHDWGSRDATFIKINKSVLTRLPAIVNGGDDFVTVPMQGSGTFAVEAMLTTFVPRNGKVLLLINGAYGQRAKKICEIAGRAVAVHETAEDTPPDLAAVETLLKSDKAITHVFAVQCETTSGILNPIAKIAALARTPWQASAHRRHERFRRAAARRQARSTSTRSRRPRTNASKACPGLASSSRAKRLWKRPKATRRRWCSTCMTNGPISSRPANTASRRRSMSSSPSIRRWTNSTPKAASPGAAGVMRKIAAILIDGMRGARFRAAASRQPSGADHRHLPHAGGQEFRVPDFLRPTEGSRLRHLSGQAHGRRTRSVSAASAVCIRSRCAARSPRSATFSTRWAYVR